MTHTLLHDVLSTRAHLLPHRRVRLVLQVPGAAGRVSIDTRRSRPDVFDGGEWLAMAAPVQNGKLEPNALQDWCEDKRTMPGWRLDPAIAQGGLNVDLEPSNLTVAQVLDCLGATLVVVVIDGDRREQAQATAGAQHEAG